MKTRDEAEDHLLLQIEKATREFLDRVVDTSTSRVREATPSSINATTPTMGTLLGWWAREVNEDMIGAVREAFSDAYTDYASSVQSLSAAAGDPFDAALASHIRTVRDRLSPTADPAIPEAAFEQVRESLTLASQQGWSIDRISLDIAQRLAWEPDKAYWVRAKTEAEDAIDAILDPIGPPGTPARETARRSDPTVQLLQSWRKQAVDVLNEDRSVWETRARRIARTEATAAWNFGALAALEAEGATHKEWVATHDDRTRETHRAADGQRVRVDQPFTVGGWHLQFPGDPTGPPEETINCVVGSTQVEWAGQNVEALTSRWFDGEFVELVTARGHRLTCTPNHPILTPAGYFPAQTLRKGQHVLATDEPPAPQVQDGPPSIKQVQRAALQVGTTSRVRGAAVQFHGDGTESEVEVVWSHGDLSLQLQPFLFGEVDQQTLVGLGDGQGLAPSRGDGDRLLSRVDSSVGVGLQPSVGPLGVGSSLLGAESRHPDAGGLTAGPNRQAQGLESVGDRGPTDAEVAGHLEYALSLGMSACEIVEVNLFSGSHQVYNLSTTMGCYSGNGILSHNCRCGIVAATASGRAPQRELTAGADQFAYNPDQLRVPQGNGELSGRWVDGPGAILNQLFGDRMAQVERNANSSARSINLQPADDAMKAEFKAKYGKSIPPAWTDVQVDLSDGAELLAKARDANGNVKGIYSPQYEAKQAAKKYARIRDAFENLPQIETRLSSIDGDPTKAVARLMLTEGIRVGSSERQRGKVQAYGASTLKRGHAEELPNGNIRLAFTAKEGIPAEYEIEDPELIEFIKDRMAATDDPDAPLFETNSGKTIDYLREISGLPDMKNHDLRTLLANRIAMAEVMAEMANPPKTKRDLQAAKKRVAEIVSGQLRNKPAQALSSYINPAVFLPLMEAAGLQGMAASGAPTPDGDEALRELLATYDYLDDPTPDPAGLDLSDPDLIEDLIEAARSTTPDDPAFPQVVANLRALLEFMRDENPDDPAVVTALEQVAAIEGVDWDTGGISDEGDLFALALLVASANQWRVPKGNGDLSGRWVDMPDELLQNLIDDVGETLEQNPKVPNVVTARMKQALGEARKAAPKGVNPQDMDGHTLGRAHSLLQQASSIVEASLGDDSWVVDRMYNDLDELASLREVDWSLEPQPEDVGSGDDDLVDDDFGSLEDTRPVAIKDLQSGDYFLNNNQWVKVSNVQPAPGGLGVSVLPVRTVDDPTPSPGGDLLYFKPDETVKTANGLENVPFAGPTQVDTNQIQPGDTIAPYYNAKTNPDHWDMMEVARIDTKGGGNEGGTSITTYTDKDGNAFDVYTMGEVTYIPPTFDLDAARAAADERSAFHQDWNELPVLNMMPDWEEQSKQFARDVFDYANGLAGDAGISDPGVARFWSRFADSPSPANALLFWTPGGEYTIPEEILDSAAFGSGLAPSPEWSALDDVEAKVGYLRGQLMQAVEQMDPDDLDADPVTDAFNNAVLEWVQGGTGDVHHVATAIASGTPDLINFKLDEVREWLRTDPEAPHHGWFSYVGPDYREMNSLLRSPDDDPDSWFDDTGSLDKVGSLQNDFLTGNVYHTSQRGQLFRGAKAASGYNPASWEVGETRIDAGFHSASSDLSTAKSFGSGAGNWLFHVEVPEGMPYMPGYREEEEFIFPEGTQFEVIRKEPSGKSSGVMWVRLILP